MHTYLWYSAVKVKHQRVSFQWQIVQISGISGHASVRTTCVFFVDVRGQARRMVTQGRDAQVHKYFGGGCQHGGCMDGTTHARRERQRQVFQVRLLFHSPISHCSLLHIHSPILMASVLLNGEAAALEDALMGPDLSGK